MTDNTELKRLAEASLGEWYEFGELRCEDRSGYINGLHHDDEYFIAAANPAVVLALIAENERLKEGAVEDLRLRTELMEQYNQLKAENEALRKEVARLKEDNLALLENPGDAL